MVSGGKELLVHLHQYQFVKVNKMLVKILLVSSVFFSGV